MMILKIMMIVHMTMVMMTVMMVRVMCVMRVRVTVLMVGTAGSTAVVEEALRNRFKDGEGAKLRTGTVRLQG